MKRRVICRTILAVGACLIVIALAVACVRLCVGDTTAPRRETAEEELLNESSSVEEELLNESSSVEEELLKESDPAEEELPEESSLTEEELPEESSLAEEELPEESSLVENAATTLDLSSVTSVLYHEGGGYISDVISGVSYSSVLDWLSLHREDDYYLGTPYPSEPDGTLTGGSSGSTDRRNPNGDCEAAYGNDDYEGVAMLNCTGFVWHVFYKASGMTETEAFDTIPCWGGVGAKDWISYLRRTGLEYKTYYGSADSLETLIADMIADGYMEPGDIIWTWGEGSVIASDGLPSSATDPHVGIYTGTYFGGEADEWWHSLGYSTATDTFYGENLYDSITPMAPCIAMTVIKLGE